MTTEQVAALQSRILQLEEQVNRLTMECEVLKFHLDSLQVDHDAWKRVGETPIKALQVDYEEIKRLRLAVKRQS